MKNEQINNQKLPIENIQISETKEIQSEIENRRYSDFKLIRKQFIKEFNGVVKEYRHEPTGSEYLSIENEDDNKVFGITFRTPPTDSTGVAHIIEHAVLCGSRNYPVKDPFVQLLKGSLQTFLNAMTFPDKTVYPVASQNEQDFYHLVDVYLDAVFFPRITPACFHQEGWHYELTKPDAPLLCKGVVYNEMKGVYSSPESLLLERSQQILFPDMTYGFDSGGNPSDIPSLTYRQFRTFHETHYHPSNARIFFYGNDDPNHRQKILSKYLDDFQPVKTLPDTLIPLQKPLQPIEIQETYPMGETESKAFLTVNWVLPDDVHHFSIGILDQILIGTSGSPLRKALIESGLGEDLVGSGLETHLRQPVWSIGMKGIEISKLKTVETLIFQTLEKLIQKGIEQSDIDAALNSFEFELRENNHGTCPQGLSIMLNILKTWLYDLDPMSLVAYEHPLAELKQKIKKNSRYFEDFIEKTLLNNSHRAIVRLLPDGDKARRDEMKETDRLQTIRAAMTPEKLAQTVDSTAHLLKMQQTPDSQKAIKTLPLLRREDLRKKTRSFPRQIEPLDHRATVLFHDLFTKGIVYIDMGFDLHVLDAEDLPFVSLLGSLLLEMGTQKENFAILAKRIAQKTGGLYVSPLLAANQNSPESVAHLFLRGKCMSEQTHELFDIFHDILFTPAFDNRKRFREILLEQKAEMEGSLIPSGHTVVLSRLKAHFHEAARATEIMGGMEALFFHREIQKKMDEDWPQIVERLEGILQKLLTGGLIVNITADGADRMQIVRQLKTFLHPFPKAGLPASKSWNIKKCSAQTEALLIPSRVNYVGQAINLFDNGYQIDGSSLVITNYLRTAWLWEKIRVQGGAYGAICTFDSNCGVMAFASYRDPNLTATLDVYARTTDYLKTIKIHHDDLTRALIGAIGRIDTYLLPDAKGYCDMIYWLTGQTDEKRQKRRDEILATTAKKFRQLGEYISMDKAVTSVLSSANTIQESGISFDQTLCIL